MDGTVIYSNFVTSDGRNVPVFSYQGGATWAQVESSTAGSGLVAVGSRCSSVGVGGISTGGGIGLHHRGFFCPWIIGPFIFCYPDIMMALRFDDPISPDQPSYSSTFTDLFLGLTQIFESLSNIPYMDASAVVDPLFPYGFCRGFFGPKISNISVSYLQAIIDTMSIFIKALVSRGETPATTAFVVQYMMPGLNGHLPQSDTDTAWFVNVFYDLIPEACISFVS
jgi:hypothetical protein